MEELSPDLPMPMLRADAARNRERILQAARAAFADSHSDPSMAEIARRSGVGSATLYRNFANRRELLEALYVDEIDGVCEAATAIVAESAGAVLDAWLRRFYVYFTSKRPVAAAILEHTDRDDPVFDTGYARVINAGRPLVAAARQSGQISADLSLEQLLDMVVAIAKIPGTEQYRAPILDAALRTLG